MGPCLEGVAAAILAGGFGTRLRSVVADRPKVLAEVAGRPFLAYLIEQLSGAGIRETHLLTGYAADRVHTAFGDQYAGMKLRYSVEPTPLGTAGALRLALAQLGEPIILLLNGDSYCDVPIPALLDFHRRHRGNATVSLTQVNDTSRYGRVHLGEDDLITQFEEKGASHDSGWINAGVYVLNRDALSDIPANRAVSFEREVLPGWVGQGRVYGFRAGRFIDIGTPESYDRAEEFFFPSGF